MSTSHSNSEQRPTCKMTPEQLLGLQSRAKTSTLSPEISIIDPDAAPSVILAAGTLEVIAQLDDLIAELPTYPTAHRPGPTGAIVGFALFAVVTTAEILVAVLS